MTLPERLMKLRKAANLSQEDVAEALEVTRQTVSKWETGQSSPDLDKVKPLCDLYHVSPDSLLSENLTIDAAGNAAIDESKELEERINMKKKLRGILLGVMIYVLALSFIMTAIPVFKMNAVVASAIFILIVAAATVLIVYTSIVYRQKKKVKHAETKEEKLYKNIDSILALTTLGVYLIVSFITMTWHITWIIWVVYAILTNVAKMVIMLVTDKDIDDEK